MAFKAGQGLGLAWQLCYIEKIFDPAALFAVGGELEFGDGEAARAVTRLAVDQRQAAGGVDLLAMHRLVKIALLEVVGMTFGEARLVTDVIGIETTDDHALVVADRRNRLVSTG